MNMNTLSELLSAMAAGETSSESLIDEALARIALPTGEGARAFTRVYRESAVQQARVVDGKRRAGATLGPLAGLPISVKDLFDIEGETTHAGSIVLKGSMAAKHDAEIVRRLRAADAVIIGRTNMTEFAFSGIGINPHYGTPKNPWDRATGRIPGGSSSGAAVSVTDRMAAAAIGTDTGGSVRIPAALCGITGFKPTAKRVPKDGCLPLSTTLDSIGPLARSVACCARVDAVLSGESMRGEPVRELAPPPLRGLRIGVVRDLVGEGMDEQVARSMDGALSALSALGVWVQEMPFPELLELPQVNRFGGFSTYEAWHWHRDLLARGAQHYDPRVAVRLKKGADFSDAAYEELKRERARIIAASTQRFAGFDALVWAVSPVVAPPIAALVADDDVFTRFNALILRNPAAVNFLDGCALSLPCHAEGDAPVGLMLVGRAGEDRRILDIGAAIEEGLSGTRIR